MDLQKYKQEVIGFSDDMLIAEYFALLDEMSYDFVSLDWDKHSYDKYWHHDRPVLQEEVKIVENEISYRNIQI